jgi:ATP-binding cassette subfamily B protein
MPSSSKAKRIATPEFSRPWRHDAWRLLQHVSPRRRLQLALSVMLMLAGAVAEMALLGAVIPFLSALTGGQAQAGCAIPWGLCGLGIKNAAWLFALLILLATVIQLFFLWFSNRLTYAIGAELSNEVYRRVLYQPYGFHAARNTSETIAMIGKVDQVVQGMVNPVIQGAAAAVIGACLFLALLYIDARTASVAMAGFALLYALVSVPARRWLARAGQTVAHNLRNRVQAQQEGLGGIRDVLLDGTQPVFARRFAAVNAALRHAQVLGVMVRTIPPHAIRALGMLLIVVLALWVNRQHGLVAAIPVLGSLVLGAQRMLPQLQQVYQGWAAAHENRAILREVLTSLGRPVPNDALYTGPALPAAPEFPVIELRGVGFRYPSQQDSVLEAVSLSIPRGARVGFIGKTGSGKSTLIDLIMGLIDPVSGEIRVEGQPLSHANRRAWQKRLAHVPQFIYLADVSLAENIAFGAAPGAIDMARVKRAAAKAQLADFVETLPGQYQTSVGERGVRLSGGQRQRIGLARAFYKQADILVLDEATSALDNATEAAVMQAIDALGSGMTVLIIAHRLSTLRGCDQIIELGKNRVLRTGSYRDVVESNVSAGH